MKYNPEIHNRHSIRLKGYDYSNEGLYFITICVKNRKLLFGDIINGIIILNDAGKMVDNEWKNIPNRFSNVKLHQYVVMPNHFHAILEIVVGANLVVAQNPEIANTGFYNNSIIPITPNRATTRVAPTTKTVGDIVGAFQSLVTVKYIHGIKNNGWETFIGKLWQRNYYEHIIRDDQSYQRIVEYINNNIINWKQDKFFITGH